MKSLSLLLPWFLAGFLAAPGAGQGFLQPVGELWVEHLVADAVDRPHRLLERFQALAELGRRQDVEVPTGESRGEPYVLPPLADRQ